MSAQSRARSPRSVSSTSSEFSSDDVDNTELGVDALNLSLLIARHGLCCCADVCARRAPHLVLCSNCSHVSPAPPSAGTVFPPPRPLPPGPATGTSLTLDGGMVCVPKKRKKRWDAGLTKEQKAALKAVKEAEKAKKAGRQRGAGSS